MMLKSFFTATALAFALVSGPAVAETTAKTYVFDSHHAQVELQYSHMGFSNPTIKLVASKGEIKLNEADLSQSSVTVEFDITQINSGYAAFDTHLKSADMFDTDKYPTARFKSTKVEVTGADTALITGDLTIKDVTKPVTLNVRLNKKDTHPMLQKPAIGFSGKAQIKRSDFGIDYAVPAVGDDVTISIEVEAQAE